MKSKMQIGMTIIELIAVVAITAVLVVTSVGILVNSQVRGTRTETLAKVRQEGEFAERELGSLLRGGLYPLPNQNGETCNTNMTAFRFRTRDEGSVELYETNGRIASHSGALVDPEDPTAFLTSSGVSLNNSLQFDCIEDPSQSSTVVTVTYIIQSGTPGIDAAEKIARQTYSNTYLLRSFR